ncbi:MAG: protein kinase [Myxococcales bacterium]|nr:protein kinase [Myxococcales bacterium]
MAEELPRQFGDYVLERRLGVGGMAETFVARRGVLQQRVCLKRVLPAFSRDADFVRQFEREARLAGRLRHSNVVGVLDFGGVGGELYLALELVEGVDLRALIQTQPEGRLPIDVVALIALDLSYALEYAHGEQVVHRDVTPSNVLLSVRGEVKLADFGVAKALTGSTLPTASGFIKGKVPYMAPEQMKGGAIDGRTDLFSVGVTLFEMIAGRRPFIGSHDVEIMMKVMTGERPTLKELAPRTPAAIAALVEQLLAGDPNARPRDAGELLDVLAGEVRPDSRERLAQWVRAAYGTEAPGERDTELASSPIGVATPRPAMRAAPSSAPPPVVAPVSAPPNAVGPAAHAPVASASFDPSAAIPPHAAMDAAAMGVMNATAPARPAALATVVDPPGGYDEAASSGVWAPGTRREPDPTPSTTPLAATRVAMPRPERNDPPSAPRMLAVEEPPPKGRAWGLVAALMAVLFAGAGGAFLFVGDATTETPEEPTEVGVGPTGPDDRTEQDDPDPNGPGTTLDPGDPTVELNRDTHGGAEEDPIDPAGAEEPEATNMRRPPRDTSMNGSMTENPVTMGATMEPAVETQPVVEPPSPPPPPPPPPSERSTERGSGRALITVMPWGEVWIDNQYIGRAPINRSMPAGTYTVRAGHGRPSSRRFTLRVDPNRTTSLEIPLDDGS